MRTWFEWRAAQAPHKSPWPTLGEKLWWGVRAANAGSWGNLVRLDVDYQTGNPDSTFNLSITRYQLQNGKLVFAESETYRNLSMNSFSSMYAPNAINGD